jgi:hypothetical protein
MSYPQGPQGPPPGWVPYGPPPQPPKKSLMTRIGCGGFIVIVFGIAGSCALCRSMPKKEPEVSAAALSAQLAETDRKAAEIKAAAEAKEKKAVETFPAKSVEITATIKKASGEADTGQWALADKDIESAIAALQDFGGTSLATDKQYIALCDKAAAVRKRVEPHAQKIAKAATAAADEKDLQRSAISITSTDLFNAYSANEVAADDKYKGKQLLVTGTVASIDKGAFGGIHLRLATPNEFMSTICSLDSSEKSEVARLSNGQVVRVMCKGQGRVLGSPSLSDCTLR